MKKECIAKETKDLFERNYEGAKNYLRPYIGVIFELSPEWTLLMDNSLTWRNFTNYEKGEIERCTNQKT